MPGIFSKPPIEALPPALLPETIRADMLRLDMVHPQVSGNKWYKLKHNIAHAEQQGIRQLLSFGGMHSNHLHALAAAGSLLGVKTIGIVRGYADQPLSQTMQECQQLGMELVLVDKKTYRRRYDPRWLDELAAQYQAIVIPEGGNNSFGQKGCEEIADFCSGYDEIWLMVGSGATYSGMSAALSCDQTLVGVMSLKGVDELKSELLANTSGHGEYRIIDDAHWGGFAKCPPDLVSFILRCDKLGLPLDPVYTAKLVYAFCEAAKGGELDARKRYLLIHTGGLQGRAGIKELQAL